MWIDPKFTHLNGLCCANPKSTRFALGKIFFTLDRPMQNAIWVPRLAYGPKFESRVKFCHRSN